jgi:hypothetical protein
MEEPRPASDGAVHEVSQAFAFQCEQAFHSLNRVIAALKRKATLTIDLIRMACAQGPRLLLAGVDQNNGLGDFSITNETVAVALYEETGGRCGEKSIDNRHFVSNPGRATHLYHGLRPD